MNIMNNKKFIVLHDLSRGKVKINSNFITDLYEDAQSIPTRSLQTSIFHFTRVTMCHGGFFRVKETEEEITKMIN